MFVCYYILIGCEITKAEMTHFQRHRLFENMTNGTKEDNILIKILSKLVDECRRYSNQAVSFSSITEKTHTFFIR